MTLHLFHKESRSSALMAAIVFGLLFVASLFLPLASVITSASGSGLDAANADFLDAGRRAALKDMVFLTEITGVVEVVRSVEVGFDFLVSADIGVGKSISTLAGLLEHALFTALLGATVYQVLASLTEVAASLKPLLFEAVLFSGAVYFLVSGLMLPLALRALTRYIFELFVITLFVLHLAVPYTIYATQWVSAAVTGELGTKVSQQIKAVHGDVTNGVGDQSDLRPWTKQAFVKKHYERVAGSLTDHVDVIGRYVAQRMAVNFIEGMLIPLGLLAMFWLVTTRLVRKVFPPHDLVAQIR